AITVTWPTTNGIAKIPFGFSEAPLQYETHITSTPLRASNQVLDIDLQVLKSGARKSLATWAAASKGTIEFIELTDANAFSNGIFFYLNNDDLRKRKAG